MLAEICLKMQYFSNKF